MNFKLKSLTKKQKIIFLSLGIAVIAIIAIAVSIISADRNKLDLSNVYTVKLEGLDTQEQQVIR